MAVVTLGEESARQGHFYVPQFEVRIEGVGLPRNVLRDVLQVTYKDSIKEIDSIELTVNNWDTTTQSFKYVGAETAKSLQENPLHRLFEPCNKEVEVWMGYVGDPRLMLKGNFTTMEPTFPSSGGPTLTVRGLNVLHQLRRKQYTYAWPKRKDSEIAEDIQTLTDPETRKKRFPLPIVTDDKAKGLEKPIEFVSQKNQYDIDFLFTRARQRGYVVFVQEADPPNRRPRPRPKRLYFGPSQEGQIAGLRDVTFELKWGISLIDFKPTLTTANQIRSVTVNGWNRSTRQPIKETVTLDDKRLNVNRDLYEVLQKCDPREEVVVDEPVFTPAQARERAIAILMDRQKEMVKASATCIGLPDLRAGQWVNIEGFGVRFSGTYFITDTTHTINDQGYTTKFNARREERETAGGASR
jgi:phage protein D